jgi:hypothetical protein
MADKMVRTQVYLPRAIYDKLQRRAAKHELTLALQIRAALEDYLERVASERDDGILRADDPIFSMIGMYASDVADASVNHDYYLYGAPKREPKDASPTGIAKEKPHRSYKSKAKRAGRRSKAQ